MSSPADLYLRRPTLLHVCPRRTVNLAGLTISESFGRCRLPVGMDREPDGRSLARRHLLGGGPVDPIQYGLVVMLYDSVARFAIALIAARAEVVEENFGFVKHAGGASARVFAGCSMRRSASLAPFRIFRLA